MSWVNHFDMASQQAHVSSNNPHAVSTGMPAISEDEAIADGDDPSSKKISQYEFTKTAPMRPLRRESLITLGLHTDSESHDEGANITSRIVNRLPSRSSTCSTWSVRSDMTSEDGQTSPITQASLPNSPNKLISFLRKPDLSFLYKSEKKEKATEPVKADIVRSPSDAGSEPSVEATLGRKRCISFACGGKTETPADEKKSPPSSQPTAPAALVEAESSPAPVKRTCSLRFDCPTRESAKKLDEKARPLQFTRKASPAPIDTRSTKTPSPKSRSPDMRRRHRGSDSTIKLDSPKSLRKASNPPPPLKEKNREPELPISEATRFHEFASSEDEPEDWVQETTVHKSRLTVDDTLKKETDVRHLTEEAVAEEAEHEEDQDALVYGKDGDEDEDDDDLDLDDQNEEVEDDIEDDLDENALSDTDDDVSDGGFQTDDEDGFADSDDESDDGSDYEWWAPRRKGSPTHGIMLPVEVQRPERPELHRKSSQQSIDAASDSSAASLIEQATKTPRRRSRAVPIQAPMPELPDSTDFVCGTIDEDRPLEAAYMSCMEQRKAAKHRAIPQDIDPTFPADEPDMDSDNDAIAQPAESQDKSASDALESTVFPGQLENIHGEEGRGRKKTSPHHSPKRVKSPAPPKRTALNRSPAPAPLKRTVSHKSPAPLNRTSTNKSPAPLNRTSTNKSPTPLNRTVSHKSPAPVQRRRVTPSPRGRSPTPERGRSHAPKEFSSHALFGHSPHRVRATPQRLDSPPPSDASPTGSRPMVFGNAFLGHRPSLTHTSSLPRSPAPFVRKGSDYFGNVHDESSTANNDEDDEDTAKEDKPYSRGAIDIVQGLERKRLRRRQKFHEKYLKKEERKMQRGEKHKRPVAGKGAQRMRQIGIDSAIYRGKHVLSV